MSKEDTSSPTVDVESLMLSCTIVAEEQSDIATADIPGAFMLAYMIGDVHLKSTLMTGALPTRLSMVNNAQYFGMLMISKYHMWM